MYKKYIFREYLKLGTVFIYYNTGISGIDME